MSGAGEVEIVMPQMGISVVEATLVGWRAQVGEHVEIDEPICDISSDKVDSEVPAPAAGRVVELLISPGDTVEVGTPIAIFAPDDAPAAAAATAPRISPVVARLAAELGVELSSLEGTGQGGRIRREDVIAAAPRGGEGAYAPPPPTPLSHMRRSIGEHMLRSLRTAATVTSWIEVDFEMVERRRRALRTTALPVLAAATIATLREFGDLNAWLEGERYTRHEDVNLGIAVALGDEGLVVPVIPAAQHLDVAALAERIADLARRARSHELSPDEVRDATFTITNPGQFGTIMATPVISQPQVAILDMEAIVRRPVVVDGPHGEEIAIRPVCVLGLSFDHRALDGAYAARFLGALRERLQAPLAG